MKNLFRKVKTPLVFAACMLPIGLGGGALVALYQVDLLYGTMITEEMLTQIGGTGVLAAVGAVQSAAYAFVSAFIGCLLAKAVRLWRPLRWEKRSVVVTLVASLVLGVAFSLDYWTFGAAEPAIRESVAPGLTAVGIASAVLYGGVVEELLLRLLVMSGLAWLVWKVFFRKEKAAPVKAIVIANVVAALLFAAGHLPVTFAMFENMTALILFRCFLFNGGFGLFFGWLYRKYGIGYAMASHALLHIVSKVIWLVFI